MCGVCGQRHFEHLMRAAGTQQRCWLACSRYTHAIWSLRVSVTTLAYIKSYAERDVVGTFLSVGLSVRHTQMHCSTMRIDVFSDFKKRVLMFFFQLTYQKRIKSLAKV